MFGYGREWEGIGHFFLKKRPVRNPPRVAERCRTTRPKDQQSTTIPSSADQQTRVFFNTKSRAYSANACPGARNDADTAIPAPIHRPFPPVRKEATGWAITRPDRSFLPHRRTPTCSALEPRRGRGREMRSRWTAGGSRRGWESHGRWLRGREADVMQSRWRKASGRVRCWSIRRCSPQQEIWLMD